MDEKLFISKVIKDALSNDSHPLHKKSLDAVNIFKWQVTNKDLVSASNDYNTATYIILSYSEYISFELNSISRNEFTKRIYIVFMPSEFTQAMIDLNVSCEFIWNRFAEKGLGYEVTSKGDKRYSPFFMRLKNSQYYSIEDYYQIVIKGWHEDYGKGKLPNNITIEEAHGKLTNVFEKYLVKYDGLFYELAVIGKMKTFTDMFDVNGGQNKIYCDLLNKFYGIRINN